MPKSVRINPKRHKKLMIEYDRQSNIKIGWKIMNKYVKYLSRVVCSDNTVDNEINKDSLKKYLKSYNNQFIHELKSMNIQYKHSGYFREWVTTKNTILKHINGYKHNSDSIIISSIIHLSKVCML